MLPINFLKQLIGLYGNSMQNFVPQYLEAAMDAFQRNQSAVRDAFGGNVLRRHRQAQHGDVRGRGRRLHRQEERKRKPSDSEVDQLKAELAALQGQSRQAGPLTIMRTFDCCSACADRRRFIARCADRTGDRRSQHGDAGRRQLVLGANRRRQRSDVHRCLFARRS